MPNVIPSIWQGETAVCIASGPSLTQADCDFVRGRAKVIVINTSYKLAPWADVLYACDARWWKWNKGAKDFKGMKYALERRAGTLYPDVRVLKQQAPHGLSDDPTAICTGKNSGYQALNLAYLFGAKRIVLLGYDMQKGPNGEMHWHKEHPMRTPALYRQFMDRFATLEQPLKERGVEVINCTRSTALKVFPCQPLEEVFAAQAVAA